MLVKGPLWFRLLRFRYRGTGKHSADNRRLETPSMGYIFGQADCPDFQVGTQRMSRVGCEIAATYNALRLCGRNASCAEIIRTFEENGYLMGAVTVGDLGSDPYAIGDYFRAAGVTYARYTGYEAMCAAADGSRGQGGVFIVSFWNRRRIRGGLHTAAFFAVSSDRVLRVLNFHGNDRGATAVPCFAELTDKKRFIVGYRLLPD